MIRMMHASLKQGQFVKQNGEAIAAQDPFICTVTEMDVGKRDFREDLQAGLGPDYLILGEDTGGRSLENLVVMRKSRRFVVESVEHRLFSGDGGNVNGWDNERGCQVVRYRRRSLLRSGRVKYAVMGVHWDAVIQSRGDDSTIPGPRAIRVAVQQSPGTAKFLRELLAEGRAVHVGADFNWREPDPLLSKGVAQPVWAPGRVFRRLGMWSESWNVDWLAFGGGWVRANDSVKRIRPGKEGNRADHTWLVLDVVDTRL